MSKDEKQKKPAPSASAPTSTQKTDQVAELEKEGKNAADILCQRCNSIVLKAACATRLKKEMFLPYMHKKSEKQDPKDGEILTDCWVVNNMFTFENVGFSNTVETTKFLICADCEIGPIGWHDVNDNSAFYISLDRIKHAS